MKQLNRIIAISLVVIATIVGITYTTAQSNKIKNLHHTKMEGQTSFKSILH
jgi:hypothetical protein